jgi:hypothetical protein
MLTTYLQPSVIRRLLLTVIDLIPGITSVMEVKNLGGDFRHLGGDFRRDPDGTLAYSAQTYVERMVNNYVTMFGEKPREYRAPAAKGYHPELDSSKLCDEDDTAKF